MLAVDWEGPLKSVCVCLSVCVCVCSITKGLVVLIGELVCWWCATDFQCVYWYTRKHVALNI